MRRKKDQSNGGYAPRDYIIYLVITLVMVLLTASFVIENIYSRADSVAVSADGVKAIYGTCIGQQSFGSTTNNN